MRNPWRMKDGPDNTINRNNFPMSFQYNGTFKYGKIYPIGLIRTIPGASYQIDSTLALNFMPTSFPIQTRQRAYVHFFYGRDRNFWKDYKDFVNGMNPELVKPYIDESVTKARTGNLLDYLGVPTTIVGEYGTIPEILISDNLKVGYSYMKDNTYFQQSNYPTDVNTYLDSINNNINYYINTGTTTIQDSYKYGAFIKVGKYSDLSETLSTRKLIISGKKFTNSIPSQELPSPSEKNILSNLIFAAVTTNLNGTGGDISIQSDRIYPTLVGGNLVFDLRDINLYSPDNNYNITVFFNQRYFIVDDVVSMNEYITKGTLLSAYYSNDSKVVTDITDETSPYYRQGDNRNKATIKLSAIPPRMYETIYNLYYRNPQNNPYILNGKPEYNTFIPTKDGGLDKNLYQLRYRNWEDDFLTTAVQTPQQGVAPLVGLTDRGATVTLTNEDGSVTRYKTNLDENGNVTGIETTDTSEPLLTQALIDAVSYGISIEDLRNVNAMQKWLELNLRKGYQYKDIIEARWGISISYNELDLPEFIGGFTQEVGLQAVTQTTSHGEGIEGALGWQAGRMYAAGSGRSITHYCEEEGYIMALLTVVPVPNYSQLLPKHWFTRDLLESYQPEFNHIGFQPITYKEVCPIQAFQESTQNVDVLEQTFGYQRPWYEYFNQVDEVHGQFRTTFKDFLINRTFDVKPELSESFLLVDPNQVNDVFAVTSDDDKIIGAIEHRIVAKLPISLYAQARLE